MTKIRSKSPHRLLTWIALLCGAALVLSACGDSDSASDADSGDGYSVKDAMRTVKFDKVPERIVVLDSPPLDALVALGITPVGAPQIGEGQGFPAYLADKLEDTEPVGYIAEPDVDAIANLAPDLIIGSKVRHEALYDELSSIATTVFAEDSGTNWTDQAVLTAAAVDKTEQMDQLLADISKRAAEVGEKVGAAGKSASIVRFRSDNFRLYGPDTFSGSLLSDMGFDLGERDWNEYSMMELSPELFEQIDGDYIFHTSSGGDPSATTQAAVTKLWKGLPAVTSDHVYSMDDDTWMVGIGVLGANLVIDQVEEALAGS